MIYDSRCFIDASLWLIRVQTKWHSRFLSNEHHTEQNRPAPIALLQLAGWENAARPVPEKL